MEKSKQKSDIRSKIISTIVTLILILSIVLCLFVTIQVLGQGYASIGGYSCFRVITGSMEPEIRAGALILTQKVDINTLEIGDIISFRSKSPDMLGKIITHRVVGIVTDENGSVLLQTRGDANLSLDAYYVDSNNLVGKIIWFSKEGNVLTDIVSFFSGSIGFMACIAIPCLVISGLILRDSVGKIKKDIQNVIDELAESEVESKTGQKENQSNETDSLDENEQENQENEIKIDDEEYEKIYSQVRAEVIEELKQIETKQQSE